MKMKLAERCKRCGRKIPTQKLYGFPVVIEDTPQTRRQPITVSNEPVCRCESETKEVEAA
jgi:hypothetical protein